MSPRIIELYVFMLEIFFNFENYIFSKELNVRTNVLLVCETNVIGNFNLTPCVLSLGARSIHRKPHGSFSSFPEIRLATTRIVGRETSLWPDLPVRLSVCRAACHNFRNDEKVHFYAPIGAFV